MTQPTIAAQLLELAATLKELAVPGAASLLQCAIYHIESQQEALKDAERERDDEMNERIRLEVAMHQASLALESVSHILRYGKPQEAMLQEPVQEATDKPAPAKRKSKAK